MPRRRYDPINTLEAWFQLNQIYCTAISVSVDGWLEAPGELGVSSRGHREETEPTSYLAPRTELSADRSILEVILGVRETQRKSVCILRMPLVASVTGPGNCAGTCWRFPHSRWSGTGPARSKKASCPPVRTEGGRGDQEKDVSLTFPWHFLAWEKS